MNEAEKRFRGFVCKSARTIYYFLSDPRFDWLIIVLCLVLILVTVTKAQVTPGNIVLETPPVVPIPSSTPTERAAPTVKPTITPNPTLTPRIPHTPIWDLVIDLYFHSLSYPEVREAHGWSVSEDGVKFVAFWEGFSPVLYNDGGNVGNCTIGYGHLVHLGPCDGRASEAPYAGGMSQATALKLLERSLDNCGVHVATYVEVPLTQTQFNVLSSLVCNWGYHKFRQSEVLGLLNQGKYAATAERLKTTAVCGIGIGCPLPGLVRRRAMESYFFLSAVGTPMWPFIEHK